LDKETASTSFLRCHERQYHRLEKMGVEKVVDYAEQNIVSLGERTSKSGYP